MSKSRKAARGTSRGPRGFVMGSEVEWGVSGRRGARRLDPGTLFAPLCRAIQSEIPCLQDAHGVGVFTAQGSRFYLDQGGHPEWCSPEVRSPEELVVYEQASERILQDARASVMQDLPGIELTLFKSNLCPVHPDEVTFGCHEAYTCWLSHHAWPRVAEQLIPHIVSRIPYAGSGRLSSHSGGTGFELSQRARHLVRVTGSETTHSRAIFSTRVKGSDVSSEGFTRLHLIAKDAHRSPWGTYLTCGATGLLVLMLNAGLEVGRGLALSDPVDALHRLSRHPGLEVKLPLADGRQLTAVEIQESYLAECEQHLQGGGFPDWAHDVARVWRETLETLAREPRLLADRLDAYCKLEIFERLLERAGVTWAELRGALADLRRFRRCLPLPVLEALLDDSSPKLDSDMRGALREARSWIADDRHLERVRFALRLQRLEFSYHELGGFYDQHVRPTGVRGRLVPEEVVERAKREPPPGSRAAARGQFIREHAGEERWGCSWQHLLDLQKGEILDLGDPFQHRDPIPREPQPGAEPPSRRRSRFADFLMPF